MMSMSRIDSIYIDFLRSANHVLIHVLLQQLIFLSNVHHSMLSIHFSLQNGLDFDDDGHQRIERFENFLNTPSLPKTSSSSLLFDSYVNSFLTTTLPKKFGAIENDVEESRSIDLDDHHHHYHGHQEGYRKQSIQIESNKFLTKSKRLRPNGIKLFNLDRFLSMILGPLQKQYLSIAEFDREEIQKRFFKKANPFPNLIMSWIAPRILRFQLSILMSELIGLVSRRLINPLFTASIPEELQIFDPKKLSSLLSQLSQSTSASSSSPSALQFSNGIDLFDQQQNYLRNNQTEKIGENF